MAACTLGEPYVIDDGAGPPPPSPAGAVMALASFEMGTQGFGPLPGLPDTSDVVETTAFHSDGKRGLAVTVTTAQWLGITLMPARDFSKRTYIQADVVARSAASRSNLALSYGGAGWCELGFASSGTIPLEVSTSVDASLPIAGCNADLHMVNGVYLWFDAGTFYVDNFRVQ
jgi:hypothetical protein